MRRIGRALVGAGLQALGYTSHRASTDHGEVHFLRARGRGALPPVVLLHGLGSRGIDYWGLNRLLRPEVRAVLAPDLLGHGRSAVADVAHDAAALTGALGAALAHALDEPAVVYGNSLGGLCALRVAIDRPELVRGLFLASPAGAASSADELEELRQRLSVGSHGDAVRFLDTVIHDPSPLHLVLAFGLRHRFGAPTVGALVGELDTSPAFTRDELASIRAPIHLFWGRGERLFPPSHLEFFRASLPAHTVVEEAVGFGHAPHLDDVEGLARRLVAFARTVGGGPP